MASPATNGFVASVVDPSIKVTDPDGVPDDPWTKAERVTSFPDREGFADDTTTVEVGNCPLLVKAVERGDIPTPTWER